MWDASTGVQLLVINGHIDWVTSVAFSTDGGWIISGSRDQSIRVWGASKGVQLQMFRGHTHYVSAVAFSTDGTLARIVSGTDDESIYVWSLPRPVKLNQSLLTRMCTNWIISSPGGDHLMWIPKVRRLMRPFSTLLISNTGSVAVDFHQSMIVMIGFYTP